MSVGLACFSLAACLTVLSCEQCERTSPPSRARTNTSQVEPSGQGSGSGGEQPPAGVVAAGSGARPDAASDARELTWSYPQSVVGTMQVVVSIPPSHAGERFPVLIALHGRGEMLKGPERGARGWIDDYGLYRALERIRRPPLRGDDLRGLYDSPALGRLNHALNLRPYRGLIIVSPYTPELFSGDSAFEAAGSFADFLVGEVLERVYRETPAMGRAETTGIDGVSLGGRAALLVGFHRPKAFAVVSSLQAAFDVDDAPELAVRSRRARAENPKLLIRLLTSEGDYFLQANLAISAALKRAGVEHELLVVPGPHDYEFNRGPGVFEMLAFHDRTLRQTSSQIRASVPDAGAKP